MKQKIAVIGAGLSGLVTLKELQEAGFDVTCYERSHGIGGVFSSGEASKCYDSVVMTTSNYFSAFSDFMPHGEPLRFWSGREYHAYLLRYARHFNILRRIRFGHSLQSIKRQESGQWLLTVENESGSFLMEYDRVVICAGQFQVPNVPRIEGIESFPGPILHSADYKNTDQSGELRGKRVLCFGCGESAANVIEEIARVAKHSVLALRRRHVHSLRFVALSKYPIDVAQSRYWHSLPIFNKIRFLRQNWQHILNSTQDDAIRMFAENNLQASDEPGSVITKTELIFQAQAYHGLEVDIGGVRAISGNEVTFNSGRKESFDAIAFCTGFRFAAPYLEERYRFSDIRTCYLQMFHPELKDSLAFIGFARPQQGGIPLISEMQARYYALICAGKRMLPENLAELAERDGNMWRKEFYETPHVFGLVNGLRYNEKMARLIGCAPPVPNALLSPRRYLRYWFHHVWPSQYRLVGPGSRPQAQADWMKAPSLMTTGLQLKSLLRMLAYRLRSMFLESETDSRKWRPVK